MNDMVVPLMEMSIDEAKGACEYIRQGLRHKSTDPKLAGTFYDLSDIESAHSNLLHSEAARLLNGEHSDIYDYLRDKQSQKLNAVKIYQQQFRES